MPANQPGPSRPASSSNPTVVSGFVIPNRSNRYEHIDIEEQTILRRWIAPAILLGIGIICSILELQTRAASLGLLQTIGYVLGGIVFSAISLTLGLLAMTWFMDAELDTIASTSFKLASIALFCCSIACLVAGIDHAPSSPRGPIVAFHVILILYFVCLTFLFKLDLLDGLTATVIAILIQGGLLLTVAQAIQPGAAKFLL